MGLDSVELVMSVERLFAITLRDEEAERARTVKDVALLVAKHRPLVPTGRDVRVGIREHFMSILPPGSATDDTPFAQVCAGRMPSALWRAWSLVGVELPPLPRKDLKEGRGPGLLSVLPKKWVADTSVLDLSFGRIIDATVAYNHRTLIDPLAPASPYEILMAVIGLSSDQLGIDVFELRSTDSYTDDLGID